MIGSLLKLDIHSFKALNLDLLQKEVFGIRFAFPKATLLLSKITKLDYLSVADC